MTEFTHRQSKIQDGDGLIVEIIILNYNVIRRLVCRHESIKPETAFRASPSVSYSSTMVDSMTTNTNIVIYERKSFN